MKAFVMHRIGETGMMDKPLPEVGAGDALIRTTAALICTSDVHTVGGAIGDRIDRTLGHEAVGVIERLGGDVRGFSVGDRVVVGAITPCWRCENCQRGFSSQCGGALGGWKFANVKDGTLAEYFHVNDAEANLAPIPEALPDEKAVYACDMMSTGIAAAENAAIPVGGTVAVFAAGPVGLMAIAGAKLLGAGYVIAVEYVGKRQDFARYYGADDVVGDPRLDPAAEILKRTDGRGVDSAIEALGSPETFASCVKVTRPGGTISNVGYHGHGETVPIPRLEWGVGMAEKTIRTALCPGGRVRMERMLRLLQKGRIDPTPLTTHRFPFSDIERAFHMMSRKEDGIIKPLILF
ncbi:MAG: NAD(P)-dependent alcohol dehydrogenase [Acidobacteriota bacterium]|nr:NAD(P)-dependent alcohol dehydrogenase [Acidobacteriota bacterium]